MNLYDFNKYEISKNTYGGHSGAKLGITANGTEYMLKFPGNMKEKNLKNINISYSNSPVCEYIGSHIYESIGICTHKTYLGIRSDKIVVACKDFTQDGARISPFSEIKTTMEPEFIHSNGSATDGSSGDLGEILETIKKHPIFKDVPEMEKHFWDMFIVDAFIGNTDRNNENWGILRYPDHEEIIPVFDNGNCLNCKWDKNKMLGILQNENALKAEAYNGRRCFHTIDGERINPYHYIQNMNNEQCNNAVKRIVPRINMDKVNKIIDEVHNAKVISDIERGFYKTILQERYEKVLVPTLEKVLYKEKVQYKQKECNFLLEKEDELDEELEL